MHVLIRLSRLIDRLNDRIGRVAAVLALVLVLIGAYNTLVRYLGRFTGQQLSSNLYVEAQWYLFSLVFLLGAAYTLKRGAHVRVDLIYGRLTKRGQAKIDALGAVLLLLPFCIFCLWVSWPAVRNSWQVWEVSPDPGGLPRYPIKSVILVAFGLLILQGFSELVKSLQQLGWLGTSEPESTPPASGDESSKADLMEDGR